MKIIVCIKQVPDSTKVEIDPESGTLIRMGQSSKINPYDLYAVETALRLRDKVGGTVTAITMGPSQAEEMMKDVYMMGVDEAVIMSDRKFAGSDVLATSYTLAQGITQLENADLIICGKQTTDGDTAQIGPAMAEHLGIPHVAWVSGIKAIDESKISVEHKLTGYVQVSEMSYPCLITVDKDIYVSRLPSYRLKLATKDREVKVVSFSDLRDKNLSRFGIIGSPTQVDKMFSPEGNAERVFIEGDSQTKANQLVDLLTGQKIL
ncbi:electron transfer flavoprotein subunit beta/FixA family protein [Eubacteriaceae bacterium ES3]|nr:electron transfer flavoprotein subunit beta/FixA family protein [Eubacteriaceae bacterium ES3]